MALAEVMLALADPLRAWSGTINGLYKADVIHRRGPWQSFQAVGLATAKKTGRSNKAVSAAVNGSVIAARGGAPDPPGAPSKPPNVWRNSNVGRRQDG